MKSMKRAERERKQATDRQLERVVEPLASYISAANRPRAALISALAVLFREVEQTNREANTHITTLLDNDWSYVTCCQSRGVTPPEPAPGGSFGAAG